MIISMIAAVASNNVIGINNQLPWYLPGDLKHFKSITTGKPVIMGRKTYESIGKPLPNRTNIVISSTLPVTFGIAVAYDLHAAISIAGNYTDVEHPETVIIGGSRVYDEALDLNLVQRVYLTEIDQEFEGDTFFPILDARWWNETSRMTIEQPFKHHYVTYDIKTR